MRRRPKRPESLSYYLRGNVVWCATKGFCFVVAKNALFAHAKVGDLDMTILV